MTTNKNPPDIFDVDKFRAMLGDDSPVIATCSDGATLTLNEARGALRQFRKLGLAPDHQNVLWLERKIREAGYEP